MYTHTLFSLSLTHSVTPVEGILVTPSMLNSTLPECKGTRYTHAHYCYWVWYSEVMTKRLSIPSYSYPLPPHNTYRHSIDTAPPL